MANVAEMGNLLLSFMSAWIVGNVEAPANANIMDPKAEIDLMKIEKEFLIIQPLKNPSIVGAG